MDVRDLSTYCGGYCGTCARSSEYAAFREAAAVVAELADAHGFAHWLPRLVKGFDYAEFRKGLDFFADSDSWLVCKKGCRQGDGGPPFCVRDCCREHGVSLCFECADFPCEKTAALRGREQAAAEYRELGAAGWLRRQCERASQGYEAHTGKYYRVHRSYSPSEA
jgi:hypothetical protein